MKDQIKLYVTIDLFGDLPVTQTDEEWLREQLQDMAEGLFGTLTDLEIK